MRKTVLWLHLAAGLAAGFLLLFMAASGMLLAFAPQLTAWAEGASSRATGPADAPLLPPSELAARAAAAMPGATLSGLAFKRDPRAAVFASSGKGGKSVWLDPATGAVLGGASRTRAWLDDIEHWHRWMGEEKKGKPLTNAAALLLIFLVPSGWLLWIPRGRSAWKRAFLPNLRLKSQAGYRNLHTTLGFWSGSVLLILGLTGAVMAYPWAEAGLYSLAGEKAPARRPDTPRAKGVKPPAAVWNPASLDTLWVSARLKVPSWKSITLRPPRESGKPVTAQIEEPGFLSFPRRSRLNADSETGATGKWEPWAAQSKGQVWRSAMTPLHTGRGFGWPGQLAAGLAAFSLAVLSWTGLSLGINRLRRRKKADFARDPVQEIVAEAGL